jgi:hypothetical protein
MPERLSEAQRAEIMRNFGSQIMDLFSSESENRVKASPEGYGAIELLLPDYFQADKRLGSADEESLLIIGAIAASYIRSSEAPDELKIDAAELTGSVLQEAGIRMAIDTHNSAHDVDERIESIDTGHGFYTIAHGLAAGDTERQRRLELRMVFKQVLRDIVCGEVTPATVDELRSQLELLKIGAKDIPKVTRRNGLIGEIEVLDFYWKRYQKKGQHVAIPSTMRGGSGISNREQTHDLDILRQRRDGSWLVLTPVEVKNAKIDDKVLERYTDSMIAHVGIDGTITISGKHRPPYEQPLGA